MILTDTHTHLYVEEFDRDRDQVMKRAMETGVKRFFIPAIDSSYSEAMQKLADAYPGMVFLMAGLHPTHVKENFEEELRFVERQLEAHTYYAIGEIGIDLYWDRSFLEQQVTAFRHQIRLAKKHGLPIVIHCRESFEEIFAVLEDEKGPDLKGIFHCFTGSLEQAHTVINYGMKLGIGGVLTFKNGRINTFMDQIELRHLVLETDAPYLAPAPYRGKRNESAYLVEIARRLAALHQKSLDEIAAITTQNSKEVFGI